MTHANDPNISNLAIVSANTEYKFQFPRNTKRIQIQSRNGQVLKFAFRPGALTTLSASSFSGAYQTVKVGGVYFEQGINASPKFYFTGTVGDVAEILYWL